MPGCGASDVILFDPATLNQQLEAARGTFLTARPFAHAVIDDFLPREVAEQLLAVYPAPDHACWLDWRQRDTKHQPKKLGVGSAERMQDVHPLIRSALSAFNDHAFIRFLEALTGISGLIPDPHLIGGGLHQILPGGHLDIHADFNLAKDTGLYRRINVILYLNPDWRRDYEGYLELWATDGSGPEVEIAPAFNRLVIFLTDGQSLHGHPAPLRCPEGVTRKSLALYYYTVQPWPGEAEERLTDWRTHGGQGRPVAEDTGV